MMDTQDFCKRLGLAQAPGAQEQILLPGDVRLQIDGQGWTAIFEQLAGDDAAMRASFDLSQQLPALVPFLTRSGRVGLQWRSRSAVDDAAQAVLALRAALRLLVPS